MLDDFFSGGRFLNLPAYRTRVSLNVSSAFLAKQSIKLYKPFSKKAILFKSVAFFMYSNSAFFRKVLSRKFQSGKFIIHLENITKQKIHSSIYYPTVSDKIVLQLIFEEDKKLAYLKVGLNENGNAKIANELEAIKELSYETSIVDKDYLISNGAFENYNYFIIKEIKGTNKRLSDLEIKNELKKLDRKIKFELINHPRVKSLINLAKKMGKDNLVAILNKVSQTSKELYSLNYEHGDFAPWNIFVDQENKINFFDFEYFVKDGLENLDFFNYHYRIAIKLKGIKTPSETIEYLKNKVEIDEFWQIFSVFLINKILVNSIEGLVSEEENRLLEYTEDFI